LNILIIGYGSIARRHEEVLFNLDSKSNIDIVTKQKLVNRTTFVSLTEVIDLKMYDYFVIASETNKHYEQLKYLEDKLINKLIFCEKPLFEKSRELKILKNSVVIGYVLRFHPMLQEVKNLLKNDKIISINAKCGSYLPTWRQNIDYKDSYSAKKDEGGGVLLDLSHELDYIQWLSGKITEIKSYQLKVSDLEIDSDDLVVAIGKTEEDTVVNFSIDYISKIAHRLIIIDTNEKSFKLDFTDNSLIIKDKNGNEEKKIINFERNDMFYSMHKSALSTKEQICTFEQGLDTMSLISNIQGQNI